MVTGAVVIVQFFETLALTVRDAVADWPASLLSAARGGDDGEPA
jgi:hypothetical protein